MGYYNKNASCWSCFKSKRILDTIKIGMENLQNIMSGNTNLYSALDDKYDETIKLITVISEKYSFWDSGSSVAGTVLAIILVFLGFLLGIIPSFLIVVITGTTLKILMLLAPIVIYSWIYPWFRNVFTQWLQIFITNLLTVFRCWTYVESIFTKIW